MRQDNSPRSNPGVYFSQLMIYWLIQHRANQTGTDTGGSSLHQPSPFSNTLSEVPSESGLLSFAHYETHLWALLWGRAKALCPLRRSDPLTALQLHHRARHLPSDTREMRSRHCPARVQPASLPAHIAQPRWALLPRVLNQLPRLSQRGKENKKQKTNSKKKPTTPNAPTLPKFSFTQH